MPPTAGIIWGRRGHRCILSGRGARRSPWSRCASARRRGASAKVARRGTGPAAGRPGRAPDPQGRGDPRHRTPPRSTAPTQPARLADEGHLLTLDRVEAHPQRGRLLLRRPRGRMSLPRRPSSALPGRSPWVFQPSTTPGDSGPCSPRPSRSRSSDRWSQTWKPTGRATGAAWSRSPSSTRWRVAPISSSRVTRSPRRGSLGRLAADHRLAIGACSSRPRAR